MVQPAGLEDVNWEGGVQLSERYRVYVPVGIERRIVPNDVLTLHGSVLRLNGQAISWGSGLADVAGTNPLAAAFDDHAADYVEIDSNVYVVETSRLWAGDHVRAIVLRET